MPANANERKHLRDIYLYTNINNKSTVTCSEKQKKNRYNNVVKKKPSVIAQFSQKSEGRTKKKRINAYALPSSPMRLPEIFVRRLLMRA